MSNARALAADDMEQIADVIRHMEALRNPGAAITVEIGRRVGPRVAVKIIREMDETQAAA